MQLDTAIEQRKREINNISNDINGEKDQTEAFGQNLRQKQLDLLNAQLDRSKMLYKNQKFATMGTRYNEISTSKLPFYPVANIFLISDRFQAQMQDNQAGSILEQERQRN
jgi:hypothetical protein